MLIQPLKRSKAASLSSLASTHLIRNALFTLFSFRDSVASVESVKAASDIYSPVDGKVVEVNSVSPYVCLLAVSLKASKTIQVLSDKPGLVNEDPESAGWFAKLELSDPDQVNALMTEEQYKEHVEALKQ